VPKTLTQFRDSAKRYIQDVDSNLNDEDIDDAITRAVYVLSRRNPRIYFVNHAGTGTAFEWQLGTYWIQGLSSVAAVFYPWETDDTYDPVDPLRTEEYFVYEKTSGVYWFKLRGYTPSSSEIVRVLYRTKQEVTDVSSGCTITNPDDEYSAILLAAGLCLKMLAARAIAVGNPTLGADTVSYQSRSGEYARRADELIAQSGLKDYLIESQVRGGAMFVSMGKTQDPVEGLI
jgi:hypothetical protein